MPQLGYDEFELLLDKAGDSYNVRVVDSPTGPTDPVPFQLPGGPETLKLLVLTLRAVRGVRALEADTAPDAKKYGAQLFDALFHDDVLSALRGSLHVANTQGRGLRVRLKFADPTTLVNVPWELLYDTERHRFLCQYGKYPIVRYIEIPEPVTPLKVTGPVRMLVVISSPRDYPELDAEGEWQRLQTVLKPLVDSGRLIVDRLPKPSLAAIHRALLEEEYHVFHYIGHGGVDPKTGDGVLAMTGPDGLSRLESGNDLGVMLSNSPIRLAVLNSCEGARISDVDPYAGTAISLVQQGIPAVVAMQFEVSDEAAFAFSSTLYQAITEGRPIDLAVTLARQAVLAASRSEWAAPVLYLRTSDGVIFDISTPPIPATLPVTPPPKPTVARPVEVEAPPVPPPAPPPAPLGLTGTVVGRRDVDLRWEAPQEGALPMVWEVRRDGVAVTETTVPGATDVVPGAGTYTYTVVAKDDEGRGSPASEPISVTVEAPAPARAAPPPPPEPTRPLLLPVAVPGRPDRLVARAVGRRVQLEWAQPEDPAAAPVAHWEIVRDGSPVGRVVGESRAVDDPGKGRHTYAVTAVASGGGRSAPSEDRMVKVGGGRGWLAIVLVVALLGAVAAFVLPKILDNGGGGGGDGPPSAPTNLVARPSGLTVQLTWDTPDVAAPAPAKWRVYRDGTQLKEVTERRYTDAVPEAATYAYFVTAVGEDGKESAASAGKLVTVTGPTTVTTTAPAGKADLRTSFPFPDDAVDKSEIRLRVDNDGPSEAKDVKVTVRTTAPEALLYVTMGSGGSRCKVTGGTPVCVVGSIRAGGVLNMVVHVDRSLPTPFTITAVATSAVTDPKAGNDSAILPIEVVTPITTTGTATWLTFTGPLPTAVKP